MRSAARHARASVEDVRREIAAAEARAKALQPAAGDEGALGARAVWSAEAPPPRVVAALAQMLPRDVRLETLILRYGAQLEVEMTLTARTAADYDRFLQALESSPAFDRVVLGDESRADAVRASVPGAYNVIPATAREFYFPEVYGRSAGSLFTVTAAE